MLIGITGLLGSGKTLLQTILAYIFHKYYNLSVKSNYYIEFGEKLDINKLISFPDKGELDNTILALDEFWTIVDSRLPQQTSSRLVTYYFAQSRKRGVIILWTSQLKGMIDLRIHKLSDSIIYCSRRGKKPNRIFDYIWFVGQEPVRKLSLTEDKASLFYDTYKTGELVFPTEMLGKHGVSPEDILELYKIAETKKSFQTLVRSEYPNITIAKAETCYELLNKGKKELGLQLLGIDYNGL